MYNDPKPELHEIGKCGGCGKCLTENKTIENKSIENKEKDFKKFHKDRIKK